MKKYFLFTLLIMMFNHANAFELNLLILKLKVDKQGFRSAIPKIVDSYSSTTLNKGSFKNKGSIDINLLF